VQTLQLIVTMNMANVNLRHVSTQTAADPMLATSLPVCAQHNVTTLSYALKTTPATISTVKRINVKPKTLNAVFKIFVTQQLINVSFKATVYPQQTADLTFATPPLETARLAQSQKVVQK